MGVHRHHLRAQHVRLEIADFGWFVFETNHPRVELGIDTVVVGDDVRAPPVAEEVVGRPGRPPRSMTQNSLVWRVSERTV